MNSPFVGRATLDRRPAPEFPGLAPLDLAHLDGEADQRDDEGEHQRPHEHAHGTERADAPEHPDEHRERGDLRPPRYQDRAQHVVEGRDEPAPGEQEHGRDPAPLQREHDDRRHPDDRRAHERHQREQRGQHPEHDRRRQPDDGETGRDQDALQQRGNAGAENHGAHDAREVLEQPRLVLRRHGDQGAQHPQHVRAVADDEEQHEHRQHEAEHGPEGAEEHLAPERRQELQHRARPLEKPRLDLRQGNAEVLLQPLQERAEHRHRQQVADVRLPARSGETLRVLQQLRHLRGERRPERGDRPEQEQQGRERQQRGRQVRPAVQLP